MPRALTLATIQMDGSPAPQSERLKLAAELVKQAAEAGANFIVLPALFNTGATYLETNYEHTEHLDGATFQWMCQQARTHQIHLAGSWMILEHDETYHAAFLIAPDGRSWRSDQRYPFLWERVFYRDHMNLTIADTSAGKIGLMIGWDVAHPELWERYAARIDLLLILTAQPDWKQSQLAFPDGTSHALRFPLSWVADQASLTPDQIAEQVGWLGIPSVCAGFCGEFRSILPAPLFSVGALTSTHPDLWESAQTAHANVEISTPFMANTLIFDCEGKVTARVSELGSGFTHAEISLPDATPMPHHEQPTMKTNPLVFWLVDMLAGSLFALNYRRGVRRQWGARMAPPDPATRNRWITFALAAVVGWLLGSKYRRRQ